MHTVPQYKKRADRLRDHLQSLGIKITRSIALEAQAVQEGVRDWNTLAATAKIDDKSGRPSKSIGPCKVRESSQPLLAQYIGKQLPETWPSEVKAEIDEVRAALFECFERGSLWSQLTGMNSSGYRCTSCQNVEKSNPKTSHCPKCGSWLAVHAFAVFGELMQSTESFHAVRWAISRTIERPILGLVTYSPFDHQPSPLEVVCRSSPNGIVELAAREFGLQNHFGKHWSNSHSFGCELRLAYYGDPETVATELAKVGISRRQSEALGWMAHHGYIGSGDRSQAHGLVVTFLEDPEGGPSSFWGYRPKSLRAREGFASGTYTVGLDYPKDTVFLSHLIDPRPLVLVTGFMHALALREAGINAVAVPFLSKMTSVAINTVIRDREMVVACFAANTTHDLKTMEDGMFNPTYMHLVRYMNPLESYEGRKGFLIEQFIADFEVALSQPPSV